MLVYRLHLRTGSQIRLLHLIMVSLF